MAQRSFHNYAEYALSSEFRIGLERLIEIARTKPCAMMCSEAVWWRCHRRIVADYLLGRGEQVIHLMGNGRQEAGHLTQGAIVRDDFTVVYPPVKVDRSGELTARSFAALCCALLRFA